MKCGLAALHISLLHYRSQTRHQYTRVTRKKQKPLRKGKRVMRLPTKGLLLKGIAFPSELECTISHPKIENFQLAIQELFQEYSVDGV